MIPQIPYAAIGIGIAVIVATWAFIIAETAGERAVIAGVAILLFLVGSAFRSLIGQVIALVGWVVYGVGCLIFLRLKGMGAL